MCIVIVSALPLDLGKQGFCLFSRTWSFGIPSFIQSVGLQRVGTKWVAEHACTVIEKVESPSRSNYLSGVLSQSYSRFCLVCRLREIFNSLFHAGLLCVCVCVFFFFFFFGWAGFCSYMQTFSSCGKWGCCLVEVCGLLIAVASVGAEHSL